MKPPMAAEHLHPGWRCPPGLPPQRGGGVATPAFSDVTWFAPFVVCWAYLRASRCVGRRLTEVGLGC